ncbi:hypothetical protein CEXT_374191 [Caerostris extrusa]|uniref:Uncharacterized protein n=1 Tax=Caerostris extrusa TaxID=172846 RepID=A0AAV4Y5C2_CAEEX|nr:hypothetical protein CEXT_374191 [Caerostris extrusa]
MLPKSIHSRVEQSIKPNDSEEPVSISKPCQKLLHPVFPQPPCVGVESLFGIGDKGLVRTFCNFSNCVGFYWCSDYNVSALEHNLKQALL